MPPMSNVASFFEGASKRGESLALSRRMISPHAGNCIRVMLHALQQLWQRENEIAPLLPDPQGLGKVTSAATGMNGTQQRPCHPGHQSRIEYP